ncbi:MAG: hypothetical protein KDA89_22775 [Planctomycetaceae bacterium]|nr:hypothetical protein [Planctomycetaceae bacterium]
MLRKPWAGINGDLVVVATQPGALLLNVAISVGDLQIVASIVIRYDGRLMGAAHETKMPVAVRMRRKVNRFMSVR